MGDETEQPGQRAPGPPDGPGRPDDETRDSLAVNFGGIAAEMALLSEGTLGGSSDVSSATQTALGRISAGLTDDPAPLDLDWLGANVEPIRRFAATLEAAGEALEDAMADAGFVAADR